ncbi:MAG TPA: hypothetical protein VN893_01355 [Bryobacteraceae bacterium]|nr:hypothetical protein [Bryobacteraceae bacterium]
MLKNAADLRLDGAASAEAAIRRFLGAARQPALIEPGEDRFLLAEGTYALEWHGSRLLIQVWDERRNLARRVVGVQEERTGKLELVIERFGGIEGRITLQDVARAGPAAVRRTPRLVFREEFRRALRRQFPEWRVLDLSTESNLEESLSPAYPRALVRKGGSGWAAIASPPGGTGSVLTFGLIWLDYLRKRERRVTVEGLALFLPQAEAGAVCLKLSCLNPRAAQFAAFVYTADGYEDRLDPADYGNLATRLDNCAGMAPQRPEQVAGWVERLSALPFVERIPRQDGSLSLRVRGLEFARARATDLLFGLEQRSKAREANIAEVEELARQIAHLRAPGSAQRENPLWRLHAEAWLESQVRANLEEVDASLYAGPVYGQVPAVAGGDRGVLDLLAAERGGRLAVLELKATEDIHLPLQALDYWMRVRWHAERGEFTRQGYFPGIPLSREWPRLLLVAPSLEFHPKTETVLKYFAPEIAVERIGLGVEWRERVRVMFRARGAQRPLTGEYGQRDLRPDQERIPEPESRPGTRDGGPAASDRAHRFD